MRQLIILSARRAEVQGRDRKVVVSSMNPCQKGRGRSLQLSGRRPKKEPY